MEMIHGMPESNYELSLKDIVDEQREALQEVKENMVTDERSFSFGSEVEIKKPKKKKSIESGEISRSGSMNNEKFLIKMFFPRSLGSRKKATRKCGSKVSPRASFEISENRNDREQWIMRSSVAGENKSNGKLCGSSSFKNANSSRNRYLLLVSRPHLKLPEISFLFFFYLSIISRRNVTAYFLKFYNRSKEYSPLIVRRVI